MVRCAAYMPQLTIAKHCVNFIIDPFVARHQIDTRILWKASVTEINSKKHFFNVPVKYKFLFFNYNATTGLRIGKVCGLHAPTNYRLAFSLTPSQISQNACITITIAAILLWSFNQDVWCTITAEINATCMPNAEYVSLSRCAYIQATVKRHGILIFNYGKTIHFRAI